MHSEDPHCRVQKFAKNFLVFLDVSYQKKIYFFSKKIFYKQMGPVFSSGACARVGYMRGIVVQYQGAGIGIVLKFWPSG